MRYCSTRGGEKGVSFEDCLMKGYAADGGMFMPESVPSVSAATLAAWRSLPYPQLVAEVAKLFVDSEEIPHDQLQELIVGSYANFGDPTISVAHLSDGLRVAELFRGPTLAFKDLSLSCFARLMNYFLVKRGKHATVIVATSGDTGGSAIESFRGLPAVDLIVMYPKGWCNVFQELQMTTAEETNIHCFAMDGNSDDADVVMLSVIHDLDFAERHNLTLANSANWGRIMAQMVHFFYIYLHEIPPELSGQDQILQINVPTGGAGNILAGSLARQMGLPIVLVPCTNINDVLHRSLSTGRYFTGPEVVTTWASAMDIGVPYNLERIFHLFSNGDGNVTKSLMETFEAEKSVNIPADLLKSMRAVLVSSSSSDDSALLRTMQRCWASNKYALCPHTAAAAAVFYTGKDSQNASSILPQVCIATASPVKFSEALIAAGIEPLPNPMLDSFKMKVARSEPMAKGQDWIQIMRAKICEIERLRK